MTAPAYVDMATLCEMLPICERTAEAWVRQGVLPPPKMRGGKRLWKWIDVERYLDEGGPSVTPSADPQAEGIRNATKQMADTTAENRRGHIRNRDPRVSRKPNVQGARAGNAKELSRAPSDG